ncbi:M23 family metallopeptidase [Actinomadura sp. DC4]|uniref:M23 family metallopeptidase n=1 Tax=Actinomadura sp. DC4 TaxID=3055069 RepID=UPI0025AEDFFC|nr:M23 family metallopeptidase [Actinomadura sp. DC4]MDN3352118.1 M23 family metallopeptidase [Actinomadura sp. DC4]
MRTLVNRVSAMGTATIVVMGLSLAAIVEQALLPTGQSAHQRQAAAAPGPSKSRAKKPRPSRSVKRVSPTTLLSRQVKKAATAQRGAVAKREYGVGTVATPVVHVSRIARSWAFGTEAIPTPSGSSAAPESSLFLARASGTQWTVALAGTPKFADLIPKAPESVVHKDERDALKRFRTSGKAPLETGLMLPWKIGQSWSAVATESGTWGFDGGDGRVLAAGDGLLYRVCSASPNRGMVLLVHPSGLATEYYQMDDITQVADGEAVKRGDYLGRTSDDQSCGGGHAASKMVRFSLRDAEGPISLDQVDVGGWTLHSTADEMFADRGGLRISPGNPLLNFGTAPAPTPSPTPSKSPSKTKSPKAPATGPANDPKAST